MKYFLITSAMLASLAATADEGQWQPHQLPALQAQLDARGIEISGQQLADLSQYPMNAIVSLGYCSASFVSAEGLVITNHHCGYGAIATLSSVKNNYLDDGFWAYSYTEELPAKGITALFLERMEDVTDEVNKAVGRSKGDKFDKRYEKIVEKIKKRVEDQGNYEAQVKKGKLKQDKLDQRMALMALTASVLVAFAGELAEEVAGE